MRWAFRARRVGLLISELAWNVDDVASDAVGLEVVLSG